MIHFATLKNTAISSCSNLLTVLLPRYFKNTMKAEIITIGDELLIGQVIDSNSAWIASRLTDNGIKVVRITSIGDTREEIFDALQDAEKRARIIIMTGGLGPTADDITKPALCEYFNTKLVFSEKTLAQITKLFEKRNFPMTESNRMQAMLPESAIHLNNSQGTAKGMWFEKDDKVFVSLPGVPFEMKALIDEEVLPKLKAELSIPAIYKRTVMTHGLGESFLAERISNWEKSLPASIKLAYLPQPGIVRMRLSASGDDMAQIKILVDQEIDKLCALIPELVFGFDEAALEKIIGELLLQKEKNLSLAESCTGGYLAHLISAVPGCSAYFEGSVTAYSYELKESLLGVSHASLIEYGAVSEEVVCQMAEGARKHLKTDYALATSGIAGPDGGTDEKPVGTVWIAVAGPKGSKAKLLRLGEHRFRNIRISALSALNLLREELLKD